MRSARRDHLVHFYEDDASLVDTVSRFVGAGVGAGECVLVVARARNVERLCTGVAANGIDVERVVASKQLTFLDAELTLDRVMVRGMPDVERFLMVVGGALLECQKARPSSVLRAYGEKVDILFERRERAAAIALEGLWNDLARTHPFSRLCAYASDHFLRDEDKAHLDAVCWAHSDVLGDAEVTRRVGTSG